MGGSWVPEQAERGRWIRVGNMGVLEGIIGNKGEEGGKRRGQRFVGGEDVGRTFNCGLLEDKIYVIKVVDDLAKILGAVLGRGGFGFFGGIWETKLRN